MVLTLKKCSKYKKNYENISDNFHKDKNRKDGYYPQCKQCCQNAKGLYPSQQKEAYNARSRETTRQLKLEVFTHYSDNSAPKCVCCGESEIVFLALDHINGDGGKHRKEINQKGKNYWRWVKNNGYPPGYRILCNNCNMAIRWDKVCPHQRNK